MFSSSGCPNWQEVKKILSNIPSSPDPLGLRSAVETDIASLLKFTQNSRARDASSLSEANTEGGASLMLLRPRKFCYLSSATVTRNSNWLRFR